MAEPYSDETVLRDCGQSVVCRTPPGCARHWEERNRELLRERDDARRVARSVARDWMTYLLNGTLRDPAPDVDTALAYPDRGGE